MSMCVQNNINKSTTTQPKTVAPIESGTKTEQNKKVPLSQKIGVTACTGLGVATSLALLAKLGKKSYSLNPKKILQTKWKDTYLANAKYKTKEVVTIGLGSCLGGFIGGAIFDKDKKNIKAKAQEGVAGLTNIALPVAFVETMLCAGKFISKKTMPNWLKSKNIAKKAAATTPQIAGALGGLAIGMVAANKVSNKINEVVFKQKENRPIKKEDFAAHVDDICVAATLVADKNPITNFVARFIPAFLMVAGIETGNKQAHKM